MTAALSLILYINHIFVDVSTYMYVYLFSHTQMKCVQEGLHIFGSLLENNIHDRERSTSKIK